MGAVAMMTPLFLLLVCSSARAQFSMSTILIGGNDAYNMLDSVEVVTIANKTCTHNIPAFPFARDGLAVGHLATPYMNDILAFGGENRGPWGASQRACYHFFSNENRWFEASPMNFGRFDATIHTFTRGKGGFNLVLGGGESAVETVGVGGSWTEVASARLPNDGLQHGCSVVVGSQDPDSYYIHLLGGQEEETAWGMNSHYRLTITYDGVGVDGWQLMHHMPMALQKHGCVATTIGQASGIIVTGGYDSGGPGYSNMVFFYDTELEQWTNLRTLPVPLAYHSMGLIGDRVPAIFSGRTPNNDPTADIITYNEVDGQWTTWSDVLSTPRITGGAFTTTYYNCN